MINIRIRKKIITVIILTLFIIVSKNTNAYAVETINTCANNATSEACIAYKSILENIYQCYNKGGVNLTIPVSDLKKGDEIYESVFSKNYKLALPSGFKNLSIGNKDNKQITCYDIATGKWNYDGIQEISKSFKTADNTSFDNLQTVQTVENQKKIFEGFGYTYKAGSGDAGEKCVKIITHYASTRQMSFLIAFKLPESTEEESRQTQTVCMTEASGKITKYTIIRGADADANSKLKISIVDSKLQMKNAENEAIFTYPVGNTYQEFKDSLNAVLKPGTVIRDSESTTTVSGVTYKVHTKETVESVDYFGGDAVTGAQYSIKDTANDKENAAMRAIKALTGNSEEYATYDKLAFSKQQAAMLLEGYLVNFYGGEVTVPADDATNNALKENANGKYNIATKWMDTPGTYNCAYISFPQSGGTHESDYVFALDAWHFNGITKYYRDPSIGGSHTITQQLQTVLGENTCNNFNTSANLDDSDDAKSTYSPAEIIQQQQGTDLPEDGACADSTSLGWLLCPIVELMQTTLKNIYGGIEENYLRVKNEEIDNESIREGWGNFQSISNIVLVILLLIIIFSQLTGIGIDNYNIKKSLPKLIIAIILANLSIYICLLLVDVSNITGASIKELFDSFKVTGTTESAISPLITAGATVGTAAGVAAGGAAAAFTWELWLPSLLLALIAAVISVLMFYVILMVRKALLIILTVVSPVAVVLYAIPNTQQVAKKWWKAIYGLLIAYPICGAVVGGSDYASRLLQSLKNDNFFFGLVAALMSVIPYFFLPSLIKNSMKAIGNIGNMLSSAGKRIGNSAKRATANTSTFKAGQARLAAHHGERTQNRLQSSLDRKVQSGNYFGKDGKKINSYSDLLKDENRDALKKFQKDNRDFATQSKMLKMGEARKEQTDYEKQVAAGFFSTTEQTQADKEKLWGDSTISANTNAVNNEHYFGTDEKEFTDDDGNSLGTYKYDYEKNQWRKKLDNGQLGEALDTDRIVTDKDGQKWKTDKEGTLRKVKEDGSLGEAYKRKTFKGSDGRDYHFQDKQMVDEDGKELADGVTITDENGMKFQKAGVDAEGYAQYKPVDFKPDATLDKDATYKYNGHDCHFEGDKLFYEDDEGKKVEVGEGAEVVSASGKNAGYSYKMGKNGLEFTKSKDIVTKDGKRIAFYAGKNGKFELHDVDQYNANSGRMKELEEKLELAREKLDHLPDGQARMEAGREVAALGTKLDNLRASTAIKDGTELGIGDVSFKYSRTSGTLAALNGTLKDDTAGFTYNGQALRLGSNGIFKTESGLEMKSIKPGMPAIFRDDGSGVFRDIETGDEASPEQVAKAQAENRIKSHNDLRVMQARGSDAMQVGNLVGMLGANMENYTRNAVLGAQNKTINQINNTIGEGDAIHIAHTRGLETTTTSLATTQNINKQFEVTTGGNIAARARADTFKINQFDEDDIYNKVTGTTALADLTAIANSTTERAGKRKLAQTMIHSGMYNGGRAYDTADKARKFINTFKNAYNLDGERGEFTQEEIASIERLTPQQRHEVEDVLAGRSNAYDFLQNKNVTDGQKLYLRQIWGGDTSVVNRSNPVSIFSSDPSVQAYREAMMSAASAGREASAEAVIGKTTTQVNQAVDAAAIKNQNQFNMELAENNPAVTPVIDLEQAQFIAERKFNISEINRRHEVFSRQTRVDVEREFNDALNGVGAYAHDANAITALMHTLQEKGGHEVLMKSLKNNGTQIWRKLKSNGATDSQISEIINTLTASNNMFEKDYGKTLMKILNYGGTASDLIDFDQYMHGTYGTITLPGGTIRATDKSMQAFIKNAGDNVIARTDKDNLEFIIQNGLESWFTPKQMAQASLHPEDYGETAVKAYDALRLFGQAQDVVDSMSNNEACEIKQNMLCALLGLPAGTNLTNLIKHPYPVGSTQYKLLNTLKTKRDNAHGVAQQNIDPVIDSILSKH